MCTLLSHIFSAVHSFPEESAIITSDGDETSYKSLWLMACRGRQLLQTLGIPFCVGAMDVFTLTCIASGILLDDIVGVSVEDGAESVSSLLSVLLAGAAFMPIDPNQNLERQAQSVEGCRLKLIVGRNRDRYELQAAFRCPFVDVDALLQSDAADAHISGAPPLQVHAIAAIRPRAARAADLGPAGPENLCWVYCTS